MSGHIIEVESLVKKYDGRSAVLDGISFSVDEQEFVTVHGKSGCGKTTLLNILGGLDRPTRGRVAIDGEDIVEMSENDLARLRLHKIGFVFQEYNLLMDLTIIENVQLPLRFSGRKDGGRTDRLLETFDIKHIADLTANKVSGGEAQRAAIARALMNEPKVLLADEPTGNLDEENTKRVLDMFELARRDFGSTIVLATHDADVASRASRHIHIKEGKVISEEP